MHTTIAPQVQVVASGVACIYGLPNKRSQIIKSSYKGSEKGYTKRRARAILNAHVRFIQNSSVGSRIRSPIGYTSYSSYLLLFKVVNCFR